MVNVIKHNMDLTIAELESLRIIVERAHLGGCDTLVRHMALRVLKEYEKAMLENGSDLETIKLMVSAGRENIERCDFIALD